jgi:Ser/Thr protein kinase RdoA (MazF antagonist)
VTTWLRAEVRRSFAPPWSGVTERAVFGALDPDEIVGALETACERSLGSSLRDGFLYEVSAGVVIGCELVDGRRVIVKGYQPRWTPTFLGAVKRVQRYLHASGFPCPEPLDAEVCVGSAVMLAESVLPDPGVGSFGVRSRDVLAAALAELVERCRDLDEPDLAEHPLRRAFSGAFPEPHSPIFDFDATRVGAEWIDDIALRAQRVVDADRTTLVIAHTDWSLRNVRVDGAVGVVAVYDWDSLALLRESEAIALAAATWSKTGQPDDPTPTIADIDRYADAYEARRGRPFTSVQRRALRGAAVASMAYTARCEHAIDPHEQTWTTTRPRLREAAAAIT